MEATNSKKIDPEEERKLIDYIRGEALRGLDPPGIRQKLLQAGWLEKDVVRLIDVAISKPDFLKDSKVKVMDIKPVLVVEADGNLKLKRDFVDGQIKKKIVDDAPPPVLKVYTVVETPFFDLDMRVKVIRWTAWALLTGLLLHGARLLYIRFLG